jgi:hypothetical protein
MKGVNVMLYKTRERERSDRTAAILGREGVKSKANNLQIVESASCKEKKKKTKKKSNWQWIVLLLHGSRTTPIK